MRDAVAAGVETIEHGTFVGPDGANVHDDDLSLLAGSHTVLVPTLTPTASRAGIAGALAGALAQGVDAAEFWARRRSDVARLFAAGTRMIAGSDCGVGHVAHDSVIAEVGHLATAGMSPIQALAAATSAAADVLGVGATTGRLRPGLAADVLVVAGDPSIDLGALHSPLAVFKSGRRVL
jgi:imidazolonepropionase-like amidohydrolase